MGDSQSAWGYVKFALGGLIILAVAAGVWYSVQSRDSWHRGEALVLALEPITKQPNTDKALIAQTIWKNYVETRANAKWWSGVFWGFTFLAAGLSALAGLILKFETIIKDEKVKKDSAAVCAVVAALLITIASSGDFQRKWQANRIAAAELEQTGYEFLAKGGEEPRHYFAVVARILHKRQMAIVGGTERPQPGP